MILLEDALKAIGIAQEKAHELGQTISVAVVDDYGILIAFSKMDGALHVSPKFAFSKANTAASIGLPSGDIAGYSGEGKPYFSITTAFGGEFMVIPGGVPVKQNGQVVGAVGVGGSLDVKQDEECAKAAASSLEK